MTPSNYHTKRELNICQINWLIVIFVFAKVDQLELGWLQSTGHDILLTDR